MADEGLDGRTLRATRKRQHRRQAILEGALKVFGEKGYHGAHISDIIDEVGIARGTFYLYFESKNAIFLELLDGLLAELRRHIVGVSTAEGAPPVVAQLAGTVREVLRTMVQNRMLSTIIIREAVGLDAEVDARLRAFYAELLHYIRDAVAEGQRLSLIRELDTEVAAMCILGTIKQFVEQLVMMDVQEVDVDRMALSVLDFNLRGLLRRDAES